MPRPRHRIVAAATVLACVTAAVAWADRPNVVVILADDLGYSDLGCYGGEIPTPHLDALAASGARFTQVYTSARCCPTRASLMTGLYPTQAGIGDFTNAKPNQRRGPGYLGRLNDRCVTLAEMLGGAGYGCYYVGKWHLHTKTGPIDRGFDEFYGYTRNHSQNQYDPSRYERLPKGRPEEVRVAPDDFYATDVFNDYALEFLEQGQKSGKPWFLFLAHSSPHFPVQAPAERADKHFEKYLRGWDVLRRERFARMKDLGLVDGERWTLTERSLVPVDRGDIANGYSGVPNPAWDELDEDRRRDLARRMAVFAAMVEGVDAGVGRIVERLEKTGDLDNTLILFLSDNGACYEWGPFGFDGQSRTGGNTLRTGDELRDVGGPGTHQSYGSGWANLGNTPFRLYKHFTHEGGISSPLIAHWPARIPARADWVRDPAHVMDVLPTIADATGANYPAERNGKPTPPPEGVSLLPAARGEALADRSIGFDHQGAHALREGPWKLVWGKRMPREIRWELYNLDEDRCETNDLAERMPDRVDAMAARWEAWARRVGVIWEPGSEAGAPTAAGKPLFVDPRYHGSCDPEVVWNEKLGRWLIYYTARRATREVGTYVGTPIGVASSADLREWRFEGYCAFDGVQGEADNDDTHWAPGVIVADDKLHMFATYKPSAKPPWGGIGEIRHYVAPLDDPIRGWTRAAAPGFAQPDPIDASLVRVGDRYRAYYRVGKGGGIQWAESDDLLTWRNQGRCAGDVNRKGNGLGYQEAPYVFRFGGRFWMLTDPHQGLAVFESSDGVEWRQQDRILREPGGREADGTYARHPSVAVVGDRAFVIYHTEPNRPYPTPPPQQRTPEQKISYFHMAELKIRDGRLTCDRDAPISLPMPLPKNPPNDLAEVSR